MSQTETKLIRKTKTQPLDLKDLKTVKWVSGVEVVSKTYDFSKQKYDTARRMPILNWIIASIEMFFISIFLFIHSLPWPNWMLEILYKIDRIIVQILEGVSNKVEWLLKLPSSHKQRGNRVVSTDERISAFRGTLARWGAGIAKEKNEAVLQIKDILEGATADLTENTKKQLSILQTELSRRFPKKLDLQEYSWIVNPFDFDVNELNSGDKLKTEIYKLQKNKKQRECFSKMTLADFWTQLTEQPTLKHEVESILSTLSEAGFSAKLKLKTQSDSETGSQPGLSCAFSMNLSSKEI